MNWAANITPDATGVPARQRECWADTAQNYMRFARLTKKIVSAYDFFDLDPSVLLRTVADGSVIAQWNTWRAEWYDAVEMVSRCSTLQSEKLKTEIEHLPPITDL